MLHVLYLEALRVSMAETMMTTVAWYVMSYGLVERHENDSEESVILTFTVHSEHGGSSLHQTLVKVHGVTSQKIVTERLLTKLFFYC